MYNITVDKEKCRFKENFPVVETDQGGVVVPPPIAGLRHVSAPEKKPATPSTTSGGSTSGQNLCAECERLIV